MGVDEATLAYLRPLRGDQQHSGRQALPPEGWGGWGGGDLDVWSEIAPGSPGACGAAGRSDGGWWRLSVPGNGHDGSEIRFAVASDGLFRH